MVSYTYTHDFPFPAETVFKYLDDADLAQQWIGGLESITPITGDKNEVGAKSKHIYIENGRTMEVIEETLAYDPPRHVKLRGVSDGFQFEVAYNAPRF